MQSILLGVSASIACYKAAALARLLTARQLQVRVLMTPTATRLVGTATFRALSGQPVLTSEWQDAQSPDGMDHIAATRTADLFLVAPASADFIAKAAAGFADNLLLSAFLAADCPRYVVPAMNQQMWAATATQRNIAHLATDGVGVIGPNSGTQACGEIGDGRMSEPEQIIDRLFAASPWRGQRVVISTGATVERLDAMRVISNLSSGRMGFALAATAAEAGADVKILAAQTTSPPPPGIPLRRAVDGEAMRQAALEETKNADWFFSVAAVADYRPTTPTAGKTARKSGTLTLTLSPTADILAEVAATRPALRCVGFAAESGTAAMMEKSARAKMQAKGLSLLVLNNAADAGSDDCRLTLLHDGGAIRWQRQAKTAAARELLAALSEYIISPSAARGKKTGLKSTKVSCETGGIS